MATETRGAFGKIQTQEQRTYIANMLTFLIGKVLKGEIREFSYSFSRDVHQRPDPDNPAYWKYEPLPGTYRLEIEMGE